MRDKTQPRRFLIATGVTTGLVKSGERLAKYLETVSRLFREKFGYEHVTSLGLDPTTDEMRHELRKFAKGRDPSDIIALYHTGHADIVASRHRLWMGNTGDPIADTLPTSDLAELMLADTPVNNLMIILDACFAGQGGAETLLTGMRAMKDVSDKAVVIITAAHPKEQVQAILRGFLCVR